MTSDLDIYPTTNELIGRHGDGAPIRAAMRDDALLEAGDVKDKGRVEVRIKKVAD